MSKMLAALTTIFLLWMMAAPGPADAARREANEIRNLENYELSARRRHVKRQRHVRRHYKVRYSYRGYYYRPYYYGPYYYRPYYYGRYYYRPYVYYGPPAIHFQLFWR